MHIVRWLDRSDDEQEGQEGPAEVEAQEEMVSGRVEISERGGREEKGRKSKGENVKRARR